MAETHPIIEAMARAIWPDTIIPVLRDWGLLERALAAARVILSAEPSDAQCDAVVDAAGSHSNSRATHALKQANAALLREIEGSEPATRDVGT